MDETSAGKSAPRGPGRESAATARPARPDSRAGAGRWRQRTAWARDRSAPLRAFVRTESGSATVLVAGLETRREFDLGDLRERRRFVLPIVAGVAGMIIPVGIYLLINQGRLSVHGWGVAMSTDTALALGVLAVLGRDIPDRMRVFVLTVFVVDDLA